VSARCVARDSKGQFFVPICPACKEPMVFDGSSCGTNSFRCDELLDPENDAMPLQACLETFTDGEERPQP
jgi:hypothetical protein